MFHVINNEIIECIKRSVWNKLDNCEFDLSIFVDNHFGAEEDIQDMLSDYQLSLGASQFDFGCTKMVLFFNFLPNWVVKIPFEGEISIDGDNVVFTGGYFRNERPWDYCESEMHIYNDLKEKGLHHFFVPTYLLGLYNNEIPVYISPKLQGGTLDKNYGKLQYDQRSYDKAKKITKTSHSCRNIEADILATLLFQYRHIEKEIPMIFKMLATSGITDFHEGNFGFDERNKLYCCDYGGYQS